MRTHILTVLMALIFTACASHQRDVASVNQDDNPAAQAETRYSRMDAIGNGGASNR